jgi:DNA topoisomerase-1
MKYKVEFNFLGKDSIPYKNEVELDENIVKSLIEFAQNKKAEDKLFPHVSSIDVRAFLNLVIPGLTAKQFRTATGSTLLAQALAKQAIDPSLKEIRKLEIFTAANLEVALTLNHQTAVSEAYDNSVVKMKSTLKAMKEEYRELKSSIKNQILKLEEQRDHNIEYYKSKREGERLKESIKRAKETCKKGTERLQTKLTKLKERIDIVESKVDIKEKTRGVALGTSRANYSDPRIPISWCKDNNVDLKRIYPLTAQKKFSWAMDVDADFYKKYPKV